MATEDNENRTAMIQDPPDLNRKISDAVEKMPAFPKSVQKILELTRNINCQPKELVSVIETDPVMTVKILKVLNSAYYNWPNKITSINRSVVYLGINTIKNLALSIAAIGVLPRENKAGFDIHGYLLHSLTVAGVAKLLGIKAGAGTDPMDCHIAGLLHDFGKVVFAQFMSEEWLAAMALGRERALPLYLAEREIIGVDHAVVGALLAEKWQFPKSLADSIRFHHDCEGSDSVMSACVFAANQIGNRLAAEPDGGAAEELPPAVAARCGGSLDELIASLGDISKIIEEAKLLSQIGAAS
jgi:putative nucleotidyltransferase with HDIG domain